MTKLTMKLIGQRLKEKRGQKSMREVAIATGIDDAGLSNWESGDREIRATVLAILCDYYKCSPNEIMNHPGMVTDTPVIPAGLLDEEWKLIQVVRRMDEVMGIRPSDQGAIGESLVEYYIDKFERMTARIEEAIDAARSESAPKAAEDTPELRGSAVVKPAAAQYARLHRLTSENKGNGFTHAEKIEASAGAGMLESNVLNDYVIENPPCKNPLVVAISGESMAGQLENGEICIFEKLRPAFVFAGGDAAVRGTSDALLGALAKFPHKVEAGGALNYGPVLFDHEGNYDCVKNLIIEHPYSDDWVLRLRGTRGSGVRLQFGDHLTIYGVFAGKAVQA